MVLVIISLFIIASYTAAVCIKQKGIPYSISATFYKLKHPYWFMAAMWSTAGLLMPAVLGISKPGTEFLAFLACAGMIFVGAAPNFKEEMEGKVHMSGAVICVVASQLLVGCTPFWWILIPVWLAFIVYTVIGMGKHITGNIWQDFVSTKPMFWCEVGALLAVYTACGLVFRSI